MTTSNSGCIVELVPAFMWDCPNCGRENFQRAVSVMVPPDQLPDHLDPESGDGIIATTVPERVTCRHSDCGQSWPCRDFRAHHEEDQS
jgi:hypothetical protein